MKYYCLEFDHCGYYHHQPDYEDDAPTICPQCFSPILKYNDNDVPIFVTRRNVLELPSAHADGSVVGDEFNELQGPNHIDSGEPESTKL